MWYIVDGKDLKPEDQSVSVKELNQKITETKEDIDKNYVKKEEGKGLSTNDYTNPDKEQVTIIPDKADKSNTYTKDEVDNAISRAITDVLGGSY